MTGAQERSLCNALSRTRTVFLQASRLCPLATPWAVVLGLIEILRSERGRRLLAGLSLLGLLAAAGLAHPVRTIMPGEVGCVITASPAA